MAIEFENEVHKKVHENVSKWVREIFGETASTYDDGGFGVSYGSAAVFMSVDPWDDDECTIRMWSPVISEVELTPDLMKFLLKENTSIPFGVLAIDPDNNRIVLHESLVGSSCTKDELRLSLNIVGRIVDDYDDRIRSTWGGKRMADHD